MGTHVESEGCGSGGFTERCYISGRPAEAGNEAVDPGEGGALVVEAEVGGRFTVHRSFFDEVLTKLGNELWEQQQRVESLDRREIQTNSIGS